MYASYFILHGLYEGARAAGHHLRGGGGGRLLRRAGGHPFELRHPLPRRKPLALSLAPAANVRLRRRLRLGARRRRRGCTRLGGGKLILRVLAPRLGLLERLGKRRILALSFDGQLLRLDELALLHVLQLQHLALHRLQLLDHAALLPQLLLQLARRQVEAWNALMQWKWKWRWKWR